MAHARRYAAGVAAVVVIGAIMACPQAYVLNQQMVPHIDGTVIDTVEVENENENGPPAPLHNDTGAAVIVSRPTPALPKRLDLMTNSELVTYLNSLAYKNGPFNSHAALVPCYLANTTTNCAPGDSASVFIQPEAGMNKRDHGTIPVNGVIVARITNSSPGRDAQNFGYPAERKTWWIVDDTAGTLRSRFFVRTYGAGPGIIRYVTTPRDFVRCVHADAPSGRAARAKFWNCVQSSSDTTVSLRGGGDRVETRSATLDSYIHPVSLRSSVPLPLTPAPFMLTENWVTCGSGCCATSF